MKKRIWLSLLLITVIAFLLPACTARNDNNPQQSQLASKSSVKSFSDVLYSSDIVFTCYKPADYDIVEKGNGIIEINGNIFDDRVYFKRYTILVEEVIYSSVPLESINTIVVDEFYKDAFSETDSTIDGLEQDTLYLAFAYKVNDNYTMHFAKSFIPLDDDGDFEDITCTKPWDSIADVRYTFTYELAGSGDILTSTLLKMKANFETIYGSDMYSIDKGFNYKILSSQYVSSSEYFTISTDRSIIDNNSTSEMNFFEIVAYPDESLTNTEVHTIRYDSTTGSAISYSTE